MNVVVNSEPVTVAEGDSLADAMRRLEIEMSSGIAVAVNERLVPREQWEAHRLDEGDDIVVLQAFQGG